jgi:lipid II:glycine glycyltransferase (peptidoglycan interpeptide bridge formation enzyme)
VSGDRPTATRLDRIAAEPAAWDAAVLAHGGHLLQSWRWGELKARFGWEVERVAVQSARGAALAQVLFRSRGGLSIGYVPRGPVAGDPEAEDALWRQIAAAASRRRALTVIVESNAPLSADAMRRLRLERGPDAVQPARTVKVALLDDASLLAQMHQKTRYNVRLAQRRGVTSRVVAPTAATLETFYCLLEDTAARNAFAIHSPDYYREFFHQFGDDAALLFAEINDRPVAAVAVAAFGDEAIYMYGASSTKERAHGAGFLLQYDAMRWARERGCTEYDLWGIPATDPPTTQVEGGDRVAGTSGDDWRGLYEFKTRFGGRIVDYPPPLERRYHPILASLARRLYRMGGSG